MRFWNWLTDFLLGPIEPAEPHRDEVISINPATGLPMTTPGIGGVDVGGNPYGHDLHRWDDHPIDHGHHHHDTGSIGGGFDHWSNTGATGFDPSRGY